MSRSASRGRSPLPHAAQRREPHPMSLARASTSALMGLAVLAMGSYAFVERSVVPVHAEAYRKKLAAVRFMERAETEVRRVKVQRGVVIDTRNDPDTTGLLGPQF